MQAAGVRIAPYVNGRIFDMGTLSWYNLPRNSMLQPHMPHQPALSCLMHALALSFVFVSRATRKHDDALASAAKNAQPSIPIRNLTIYEEEYAAPLQPPRFFRKPF